MGNIPVNFRTSKLILLTDISITLFLTVFTFIYLIKKRIKTEVFLLYFSINLFLLLYLYLGNFNGDKASVIIFIKYIIKNMTYLLIFITSIKYLGIKNTGRSLMYVSLYISIFSIYDWFHFINEGITYFYRASGNLGNPNTLGQTILFLQSAISAIRIYKHSETEKIMFCFTTLLNVFVVLITQSRGSIILMFILLISYYKYRYKVNAKSMLIMVSITSILLAGAIKLINFTNLDYFNRLISNNPAEFYNSRDEALYIGIKSISFIGIGIGKTSNNILNLSSHNTYVHMLQESGLVLLLFIFIYFLFRLYKGINYRTTDSIVLLLIGLLGTGFFTHNLLYRFSTYVYIILISYFKKEE